LFIFTDELFFAAKVVHPKKMTVCFFYANFEAADRKVNFIVKMAVLCRFCIYLAKIKKIY